MTNISKTIANTLGLAKIQKLQKAISNASDKKFQASLELAPYVLSAYRWYSSDEGKAQLKAEGIKWKVTDFSMAIFGWEKAQLHRMKDAGLILEENSALVEDFISQCDKLKSEGKRVEKSIKGLLDFADGNKAETSEGDGDGDGDESKNTVKEKVSDIMNFSFRASALDMGKNVSLRIDSEGKQITTNTIEEIEQAFAFFKLNFTK
jgi:hypothetical protein